MILAPLALLLTGAQTSSAAPSAPVPRLTMQQESALRCSAVLAVAAQLQEQRDPLVADLPPLAARAREFFVRNMAQLMDETGADRATIAAMLAAEAQHLAHDGERLKASISPCMLLLDASGL